MGRKGGAGAKHANAGLKELSQNLTDIGNQLTMKVTLPIVAVGGAATKLAIDFESSFAGVRKTVNATESEFAALSQGIRDMSKRIPIDVNELNATAEAAGQLGIQTENILGFTEVMAKLGVTTNLSSDEAATSLARLANITGMPQQNFDRLGSSIVALGNNLATTEREIVDFGLRIAGAGAQVGLSEAEILGFGAALSSVGLNAEAGGTAISKVMIDMASAVSNGGSRLEQFAAVAGVSAQEFSARFKEDAAGAIVSFIEGLGTMEQRGGDALQVLEQMGITEVRLRDALLRASGAGELLAKSLGISNDGWERNTALTKEAEERFKTTAAQLRLLWNRIQDVGITLGNALLPFLQKLIGAFDRVIPYLEKGAEAFANLETSSQALIIGFFALVAAIGPVLTTVGALIALLGAPFIGTVGLVVAALAGLTAAGVVIIQNWEEIKATFTRTWETLKTDFFNLKNSIVEIWEDLTGTLQRLWEDFVAWLENTVPGLKGVFDTVKGWIDETNESSRRALEGTLKRAAEIEKQRREALKNAAPNPVQQALEDSKWGANDIVPPVATMRAGINMMVDYGDSIKGVKTEMAELGAVTLSTTKETEKSTKGAKEGQKGLEGLTEGAGGAGDKIKDLNEALAEQNDKLRASIQLIGLEGVERIKMETALLKEKGAKEALAEANERLRLTEFDRKATAELLKGYDDKIKRLKQERYELFLTGEGLIDFQVQMMETEAAAKGLSEEGLEKIRAKLAEVRKEMKLLEAAKSMKKWMDENFMRWVDPFTKNLVRIPQAVKEETEKGLTAVENFASDVAGNINDAFADFINKGLKGQFDSLKDVWDATLDAMRESFAQFVAALVTNPIRISLEALLNKEDGKGYQVGDISRGVGDVLKKIPGVDKVMNGLKDVLGKFTEWIPVIGDVAAGILAFLPMITGLFKKTPRLDIDFDEVRTELGKRAALVGEFLDGETLEEIIQISVKRKAGLGAGGDEGIKKILGDAIQGAIDSLLDVINKLPVDMAKRITDKLLSTPIDTETVVGGERLFEFDAKGKKIAEKFSALINGEVQAKFFFAVDEALQFMFEELGVLPEKASEYLEQKFEEFANAGSREARAAVGQEVLDALNAYVEAFNIVEGNLNSASTQALGTIKQLSNELGFEAVPSLEELRGKLAELIQTADIDPEVVSKYVELRKQIVGLVTDLAQSIQTTISSINSISSQYGLGVNTTDQIRQALAELEEFYQANAGALGLDERQEILNQIAALNDMLANSELAELQKEQERSLEMQRGQVERQIDQQRILREEIERTYAVQEEKLREELEFMKTLESLNKSLKDDLNSLLLSEVSPLSGAEQLNRINSDISRLEGELAGATTPEAVEAIINQIRSLQGEAVKIAGDVFGVGSGEQIAVFQQTVERINQLIQLTDTQGRTSEQIQAEIEALNAERNVKLDAIDQTIERLNNSLSAIGGQEIDAIAQVSDDIRDRAAFIVEEQQAILEEQLGMLGEVTGESGATLVAIEDLTQEALVVQKEQLGALNQIASSLANVSSPANGGGSQGAGVPATGQVGGFGSITGMATGGVIAEPIAGLGLSSGRSYAFGEAGTEVVLPIGKLRAIRDVVDRMASDMASGGFDRGAHLGGSLASAARERLSDRIEIVLKDETGLDDKTLEKLAREVERGALGKVIVERTQRALRRAGR